jgi:hypothetical protein
MSSLRRAAIVALFAGAAWIAVGLDTIVRPDVYTYRDVLILIPWLATGAALVQLQRVQASRAGQLGQVGIWMLVAAIAIGAPGSESAVFGVDWLAAGAAASIPAFIGGMMLFGIATARAGVLRTRAGVAMALSEPLTMAAGLALSPIAPLADHGAYSGAVVNGICTLVIAAELWRAGRGSATGSLGLGQIEHVAAAA